MCLADQEQQHRRRRRRRRRQRVLEGVGQEEEEEEEEENRDMRRIPLLLLGITLCCLPLVGGLVKRDLEKEPQDTTVGAVHRQGARLLVLLVLLLHLLLPVVLFVLVVLLWVVSEAQCRGIQGESRQGEAWGAGVARSGG